LGLKKQVNLLASGKTVNRAGKESSLLVRPLLLNHCRCKKTHTHTRRDSPTRGIGPSHRPLPNNTPHLQQRERRPCHWRLSNPQPQQASGGRL